MLSMLKLRHYVVALLLFVMAFVLRVYNFRNAELPGFPEIIATLDALLPFSEYVRTDQIDLCPPVYYALLKPITLAGTPLWLMRLPSLLMGALSSPILYILFRHFAGGSASFLAGLLLALSPLHVFYSQQAEPLVIAALVILITFFVFLRMREEYTLRLWLIYDALLLILMHLHREAAFVAFAFLVLHVVRLWWLRATLSRLRWHHLPPLAIVFFHHFLVAVISLPWLAIMPTKAAWYEPRPQWSELVSVFTRTLMLGLSIPLQTSWLVIFAIFYLALIPAIVHVLRRPSGSVKSALLATAMIVVLPFLWSQTGRTRFAPLSTPVLALPLAYLALGSLLVHSRLLVRLPAIGIISGTMLMGIVAQNREPNTPPYAKVAEAIERDAPPRALVVTWPDFADRMSRYFLGDRYQIVTASEFYEKWAEVPQDQVIYFANYQFPWREAQPYTVWGALTQFAEARLLFRDRLNLAAAARHLDMVSMRLWYDDPETLNIVDRPTTNTLFLFVPHDRIFRRPEFETDLPALQYETNGRRCVWLTRSQVSLVLPVSLEPGRYVIRLHASPDFLCPDSGEAMDRRVNVVMRVGDQQRQTLIEDESFLDLPLEVEEEIKAVNLVLGVDRTDTVKCPAQLVIALKIYSIAVEMVSDRSSGEN